MQQQSSPQGIASLYMGNPGALQQRVQKDQQANPGLPPDLKNLMALSIVTNEQDAAKRQQAMNALNSMAPAGQEPPTVAQSLQEQAKQKAQALMLQQQRQQQGLQALAQQQPGTDVPENTPQPEQQPQGIDELPIEMALAGGGIVGYADGDEVGYETPYDRMNRENREREQRAVAERIAQIRAAGNEEGATTAGGMEALRAIGRGIDQVVPDPVRLIRRLVSDPTLASETAAAQPPRASYSNEERRIAQPAPPAVSKPRAEAAATGIRPASRPATPAASATPAAPAAPAQSLKDLVEQRVAMADTAGEKEMERYGKFLPRPDMSQYDRLLAELETRKQQFAAPKAGLDAFGEYMAQIAGAGPQRTWQEAGAKGVAALAALNKERQTQQFELTKQGIDIAQKRIDADRAYNKELYAAGKDASKRIDTIAKETATELGLDRRHGETLANQVKVANIQAGATLAAAKERAAGGGEDKQQLNELKALQTSLQNQLKTEFNKDQRAAISGQLARVNAAIAQMAGLGTMGAAPGAPSPGGTSTGWGKASVVNP